jgi:hypothetical protein
MVLALVATTSFAILLIFSLPSCLHLRTTPFSAEGVGACTSSPYSSDTSSDIDSHSGYCTSTRTFHIMRTPSFSPSSDVPFVFPAFGLFFLPNLLPPPMVTAASRQILVDTGTERVGHAPGLSLCVPSRRPWWHLPRLGYLGDDESRSEILDNQGP